MAKPKLINKTWYAIENRTIDGKHKRIYHRLGSEAELGSPGKRLPKRVEDANKEFLRKHKATPEANKHLTLKEVIDEYTEHRSRELRDGLIEQETLYDHKKRIESLKPLHNVPIQQIGPRQYDDLVSKMRSQKQYTNRTIRNRQEMLERVLKYAKRCGYINEYPEIEKVKAPPRIEQVDSFTVNELETIFSHTETKNKKMYVACMILYYTGMRPFELAERKLSDVNTKTWEINIINKKAISDDRKQKKRSRVIIAHPAIRSLIHERIREKEHMLSPYTHDGLTTNLTKLSDKLGFKIYAGKFRKTFITEKLLSGININILADWCGNSPTTIMRHYKAVIEADAYHAIIDDSNFSINRTHNGQKMGKIIKLGNLKKASL